jgi:hypothetical protein
LAGALVSVAESLLGAVDLVLNLSKVVRVAEFELEILLWFEEMGSDMMNPC